MSYRHKIPIHLDQEDHFIAALTARQILVVGCGLSIGYMLFNDISQYDGTWAIILGIIVGLIFALLASMIAFIQVKKRNLETWAVILLLYLANPRVWLWKPEEEVIEDQLVCDTWEHERQREPQPLEEKEEW